jgi:hypothetical protein
VTAEPVTNRETVTDGSDARMRMRVVSNPAEAAGSTIGAEDSARTRVHARAIPQGKRKRQDSKVRNFVLLHGGEAASAVTTGWALNESPPPVGWAWRNVPPAKGDTRNPVLWLADCAAGLFRALVTTLAWLTVLSISSRMRARVGLAIVVTTVLITVVARSVAG